MNCPRCGQNWSDIAVVRNARREALIEAGKPDNEEMLRNSLIVALEMLDLTTQQLRFALEYKKK